MRILRTGVCSLVVLGLAASVSADSRRPMVVVSAEVSATGTTLFVSGERFGRAPEVRLGGILLGGVVVNASGTHFTANLPALPPGSYKLEVTRAYSWLRNDDDVSRLTVAIGAMGAQGETGSMGATGATGAPGERGPQGVPGSVALAGQVCPVGVPLRGFSATGGLVCGLTPPVTCGNGVLDADEEFEPSPGPFGLAPVSATTCRFDFSQVTQLYCNNGCSVAGPIGCDQADADLLCKLRTGSPTSIASRFSISPTVAAPGFSCPGYGTQVPNLIGRGVNVSMFYTEDSLDTHGAGPSVTNVVCTP
jgi:collagen triple helix repeat protein